MSDLPPQIGRYHVQRQLGEGGMGVLYLATDPILDRHVALKLLRVDSIDLRRRFVREAQSAARIQHPNIVTVYDVGDHDGQLYIAMEFIDGDTLASLIRDDVPFSPIRKLDIIDEIADGLGFAHQRGIIHRDIKPANLMITRGGLVKVLDFGIARVAHRQSGEMDGQTLIGTPAYMAPEQLEGAEADARSDIYAIGLVMYELFSGRRAFAGATTADVLKLVLEARPTPLAQLVPDLDPDLARVVTRAMARNPEERYQDLQAMRKDLARARRRAMQASADDATIVVGLPAAALAPPPRQAPVHPLAPAPTAVPTPPAAPAATPGSGAGPRQVTPATHEDAVLAHLASQRVRTRPVPVPQDETVFAPVAAAAPPAPAAAAPVAVPSDVVVPPVLPPLPPPVAPPARPDEGPLPVPLPSVPASASPAPAARAAGRATVDAAPAVGAIRVSSPPRSSSPPRASAPAVADPVVASPPPATLSSVPAPLLSPGGRTTAPLPTTRKGLPAAAIIGGLVALLAVFFVAAYFVVRAIGGSGLFTTTVEPRVAGPVEPSSPVATSTPPPAPQSAPPAQAPAPATEVALAPTPPVTAPPPVAEAPVTTTTPPPTVPPVVARTQPPARPTRTVTPPATPQREARVDTPPPPTREAVPPVAPPRDVARQAPEPEPAPVGVDPPPRREPDPPVAPRAEALALVRGYVAARNTSHAAGIRRVWPAVDDVHLRRITSAFSAPLTLTTCDVEATDAAHAVATCLMTQPGTAGAYASGQALTIRRTFVFDLARQGRDWVIVGLRE